MRKMPLNICRDCGGDWFREAESYEFQHEESLSSWPTWPDLVGQISMGSMPLLVCLCGAPLKPSIGGLKGGRTPNVELLKLLVSLENCHAAIHGDLVLAAAEEHLAKPAAFQVLAGQLKALERLAGRRIAQQPPSRKSPRGRYWALPKRKPASGDVLTLDTLVIALQEIGLTARVARKAVKAIFASIIDWLKDGGRAETPLGVFEIVRRPPECTRFRLGRALRFNVHSKRVAFRISPELQDACDRSVEVEKEIPMPNVNIQPIRPDQLQCPKCGSTHFVEAPFKQYRQQYSALPGGDIIPVTENPVRVLLCLCGHPVRPGRLRSCALPDFKSFQKSFDAARQYRESTSPEATLGKAAETFAHKLQHDGLARRIAHLETILKEARQKKSWVASGSGSLPSE